MDLDEIRELIRVVTETGVAELEVQRGENRVRIRRVLGGHRHEVVLPHETPAHHNSTQPANPAPAAAVATSGGAGAAVAAAPAQPEPDASLYIVKSPIVGTFYESPAPSAPAFVKVGDTVQPGQVLCIIESMKLMNEIEAEIAGVINGKLVANGQPVEYGEALFAIKPL